MQKADYEIVATLVLDDLTPDSIRPVRVEFDALEKHAQKTGRSITSYLKGALAAVGGAAALMGVTRSVIGLQSEIQQAEAGLATLLSANYGIEAQQALAMARGEVAGLRDDAKAGVGELQNYLQGLQSILGPGLQLGASLDDLRQLNRNALAAGFALRGNEGLALAPFDVMQALSGQVGDRTTPIVMQALQAAGITAEAYRALKPEQRIEALNRGFASFATGMAIMGETWDAQLGTFQDGLKEFIRTATAPVFGDWVGRLRDANEWMERNEDSMQELAETWGQRLLGVWDHLIESASTYASILGAIAAIEGVHSAGGVSGIQGKAQVALTGLAQAGGLHGPLAASGMFGGRELFSRAGIGAMARGLVPMLTKVAKGSAILAVVAAAIDGVMGAWREFPSAANFVMGAVGQVTDAFGGLVESLGSWSGDGSILNRMGAVLLWIAGATVHAVGGLIRLGATVFRFVGWLLQVSGTLSDGIRSLAMLDFEGVRAADSAMKQAGQDFWSDLKSIWGFGPDPRKEAADEAAEGAVPKPGDVTSSTVNVFVDKVEVQTELNSDPARVYRALEEVVDRTRRYAIAARRNPAFG